MAEGQLHLQIGDTQRTLGLGNLHRLLAQAPPEQAAQLVEDWLQTALAAQAPRGAQPAGTLLPRLCAPDRAHQAWSRPLRGLPLHLCLVVDRGPDMRWVQPLDFSRWGLSLAQAQAKAMAALHAAAAPHPHSVDPDGVWVLTGPGSHTATRLLSAHRWAPLGSLAWVPCQGQLWLLPPDHPQHAAVQRARDQMAAQAHATLPWPLWPHALPVPEAP